MQLKTYRFAAAVLATFTLFVGGGALASDDAPLVTDGTNDFGLYGLGQGTGLDYDPALDLTEGDVVLDGTDLVFSISVVDLHDDLLHRYGASPCDESGCVMGERPAFTWSLSREHIQGDVIEVRADQFADGTIEYGATVGQVCVPTFVVLQSCVPLTAQGVTGTWDADADLVTIRLPLASANAALVGAGLDPFVAGDVFSDAEITSWWHQTSPATGYRSLSNADHAYGDDSWVLA